MGRPRDPGETEDYTMNLINAPWWTRLVLQVGVGTVIAFMLLTWIQRTVETKLEENLALSRKVATSMELASQAMSAFSQRQTYTSEQLLLVLRQACVNTAKTPAAEQGCYATSQVK